MPLSSGLGLTIANNIVKELGGTQMQVLTELDLGTEISFTLSFKEVMPKPKNSKPESLIIEQPSNHSFDIAILSHEDKILRDINMEN